MTIARKLAMTAAALAAIVAGLILAAHLSFVRARVLRATLEWLDSRAGIVASADELTYNLFTLDIGLSNVSAAARGHQEQPFFEAERVRVRVPWSALRGAAAIDRIEMSRASLLLHRDANGQLNLPDAEGSEPPSSSSGLRVDIGSLRIDDLDVAYQDLSGVVDARAEGIALDMQPDGDGAIRGKLTAARGWNIRSGDIAANGSLESALSYDGSSLGITSLDIASALAQLTMNGAIDDLWGAPDADLSWTGTVSLTELSPMLQVDEPVEGVMTMKGAGRNLLSDPQADLTLASDRITWSDLQASRLTVETAITSESVRVISASTEIADGRVQAEGVLRLDPVEATGSAEWTGINAGVLAGELLPVRLSAILDGSGSARWSADSGMAGLNAAVDLRARADRSNQSASSIGVDGDVTLAVSDGAWQVTHAASVMDAVEMEGTLSGRTSDDLLSSPIRGVANIAAADLSRLAPLLRAADLDVPAASLPANGSVTTRIQLSGTLTEPSVAGTVHAAVGGNVADGNGRFNAGTGAVQGVFDLAIADRAAFGGMVPAWLPAGALVGQIEVSGTRSTLIATVPRLAIDQPGGGRLDLTGSYATRTGAHDLSLRATSFVISTDVSGSPVEVVADGTLDTRGTLEEPAGSGHLTLTGMRWGETQIDRADADITLTSGGVAVTLDVPSLSLRTDALVGLQSPYAATITLVAQETDVQDLLRLLATESPEAWKQITGRANATARTSGSLADLSTLTTAADMRLESGAATIEMSGEMAGVSPSGARNLNMAIHAPLDSLTPWLSLAGLPAELGMRGVLDANLTAPGSLENTTLAGRVQLSNGSIAWPGYPEATDLNVELSLNDDVLDVGTLSARWQGAAAQGKGRVPLAVFGDLLPSALADRSAGQSDGAALEITVDQLTPAMLVPFAGESIGDTLSGRASLQMALNADRLELDRVSGYLLLNELDLMAEGLAIGQQRPTRLEIANGELRIADWTWNVAGSPIEVRGTAALTGDRALDASIRGPLDLRVIGAFVPGISTGGVGELSVAVGGSLTAPIADGTVQLRDGELNMADPRIGISGATGFIRLMPNHLELAGLRGDMNGGSFTVIGGVDYRDLEITGGSLTIESEGIVLNVPEGLQSEIDAGISVAFADRVQVSGRVNVVRGAYREPISLAASLAAATRRRPASSPTGSRETSLLDSVDLNIAVTSEDDLIVDNNYGRMDLGLDVRLVGTAAEPAIVGRASIREGGLLFLSGRTYVIERGAIDFTDPRAIVPDLDLAARTRLRGPDETGAGIEYDIRLELTGTPETIQATLTSDPARSEADIVSLLATGRLADQAGGIGGAATDQALSLIAGEALGFAARAIGVDSIRFERDPALDPFDSDPAIAAEVDPAQRLTISRRVSNFEVTFSQNLRDTGLLTWIVAYSPTSSIELRTVSRDDRSRSYELRHDVSFRGPPRAPSRDSSEARVRVASVQILGEPGFPMRDIERVLDLDPGDRFDFYRWQSDRDRLREFYTERGYFDARIAARRIPADPIRDEAAVTLEYEIDAGPRSRLEIVGQALPSDLVRELEQIWTDTIVEIGLPADLSEAVRLHLSEQGYFRARVDVRPVASTADERHIRIDIEPGPRSTSRRVEAIGNSAVSLDEIEQVVDRLGPEVWLNPDMLSPEIAVLYQERGLLAAVISSGPVRFSGNEAVLPIQIAEGDPFTLSRIVVLGADARSEADVLADFGLAPGDPFTPAAIQSARMAVNRGYSALGFNAMTSTIETVPDLDRAVVDVTLTIDEGPRQVVDTIAVSGAADVRSSVIADALGITEGAPVNLEQWYAGRRRLFRTGLFQRVDIEPVPLEGAMTPDGGELVRADVMLVRRAPWRLRYGVEVTDEVAPLAELGRVFGGGLSATLERYGLRGRPGVAGFGARVNNDQRIGRGFLTLPSLFGQQIASRLFLSRARDYIEGENILSVIVDRTAFTAEQRIALGEGLEVAYGYQIERNHTFDPAPRPDDPFAIDNRLQSARLTGTFVFDTRTDALDPTGGLFHSSSLEYAPERLGSDVRFIKYALQQYLFRELGPGIVSASAVRVAAGRGFGQELLVSERFFAGGANTVRGYPNDAIGGFDFFGDPISGSAVIVLNQELRVSPFKWLGAAAFIDAGNVFETASDMSFSSLNVGLGGGLRFRTPVGLFRLDVGWPVPAEGRKYEWYFAFGHPF